MVQFTEVDVTQSKCEALSSVGVKNYTHVGKTVTAME